MKNFREQLNEFDNTDLLVYKVLTALEVEISELADRDDESFEGICDYVYEWIMHSEMAPSELCQILANGVKANDITIEQIINGDNEVEEYVYNHM